MKKLCFLLTLTVVTALGSPLPPAEAATAGAPAPYIVRLKPAAARLDVEPGQRPRVRDVARTLAEQSGSTLVRSFGRTVRGFVVDADPAGARTLARDPRVEALEPDVLVTVDTTQSGAVWGLDRIDQRSRSLNGTMVYTATGAGVHAYVVDTGIRTTHTQFTGRVGAGYSAIADGRGVGDCNGHGTHVAGTIGGTTYGLAKKVILHPVRVFGCTGGSATSVIIAALEWVWSNAARPAVVNLSLGGGASSSLDAAVTALTDSGISVVTSAGNANTDACAQSPARAPSAITVGATRSSDARSSFSNWGSCLDVFAPGEGIKSAWYSSTTATATMNGTSMAAPHVTGAIARYLQLKPTSPPATVATAITGSATTGALVSIGTGSPNRLLYTRW